MSDPFYGEIRMFAGTFAPRSWAFCNGQLLLVSQNEALFSLLGTIYGGDGRTNFGLPDLRGRLPIHKGQGPGLTSRRIGSAAGVETVTLTTNQMPGHNHTPQGSNDLASSDNPAGNILAQRNAAFYQTNPDQSSILDLPSGVVGSTGGGTAHSNIQLCLASLVQFMGETAEPHLSCRI